MIFDPDEPVVPRTKAPQLPYGTVLQHKDSHYPVMIVGPQKGRGDFRQYTVVAFFDWHIGFIWFGPDWTILEEPE